MEVLKNRSDYGKAMQPDGVAILEGVTKTCQYCKAVAPEIEKLMKRYPDARFYTFDVDEAEDVAHELGSTAVPHFTVFNDGMKHDSVTGPKVQQLERQIKECYTGTVADG